MNLNIGEKIKTLRYEKGLTQEEVASHLGVSAQSVSKWERNDGYPDIETLPALAHYFGISVDELVGTDTVSKTKQYNEINSTWSYNNQNGLHKENVELMKLALRSFPNDALLLVQLSTSLEKAGTTDEEKKAYLCESIGVQEQIIKYCDDCEVRGATMYNICFSYLNNGEHEKALNHAKKLPNMYKSRENALVALLNGEEKNAVAKKALTPLAWSVLHHMTALAQTENDEIYLTKARQILDILYECSGDDCIDKICSNIK